MSRESFQKPRDAEHETGGEVRVRQFILVDAEDNDFLICNSYTNGFAGEKEFKIAREFLLRASILERDDLTFEYADSQTRTATDADLNTEDQEIVPSYLPGDLIYAVEGVIGGTDCIDDTGKNVVWLEISSGRMWMKT